MATVIGVVRGSADSNRPAPSKSKMWTVQGKLGYRWSLAASVDATAILWSREDRLLGEERRNGGC